MEIQSAATAGKRTRSSVWAGYVKYRYIYLLVLPTMFYLIYFKIVPIWGLLLAFQEYNPVDGILNSPWVGFKNFVDLFGSSNFILMLRNTLAINLLRLAFFFPAPIILAIMLSEVRNEIFKRLNQSIVYLPHFLSWVVIASLTFFFLSQDVGIVNKIRSDLHLEPVSYLSNPNLFWFIIVIQSMWKDTGWGTIIFLAAIAGVNPNLYEAAVIDGANRFRQIWHVTLPAIRPTIIVLLILRLGQMVNISFEQMLLMMNPLVMEVAEVFDTYTYTHGILRGEMSIGVTVGIFKGVVNLIMVLSSNYLVKKTGHEGIY